jgi:FkbM family methyltransferase
MKFYAEHSTDRIIREKYFSDYNYKGTFIEVGGATPEFLSMSKHFKDSGWRTIIIEPNPKFCIQHREYNNEVYEFACSNFDGSSNFTIVEQNVEAYGGIVTDHSFSSLSLKDEYLRKTNFKLNDRNHKIINVEVKKLDTFLYEINLDKIDILSIDVEGWELEVMQGLNTDLIECDMIVMENLFHNSEYDKFMLERGYTLKDKIEYNYIYTK